MSCTDACRPAATTREKSCRMCTTMSTLRESIARAMSASAPRWTTSRKFGEPSKRATRSRA